MIGIYAFDGTLVYFPFQHTLESQEQLLKRLQKEANERVDYGCPQFPKFGGYMFQQTTENPLTLTPWRAGMRRAI